jgi:DNA-binding GntR family transcriptional regulator
MRLSDMLATIQDAPEVEESITNRSSLYENIYAQLRLGLMSGVYEPGDRINIRKLGKISQTSPTPAREAVMQLVREGALELKPGHQPRVPVLTADQYIKIREVRVPLERLATELATIRVTDEMLDHLIKLDRQFVDAEQRGSWKEATSANQEFHFFIYNASENNVLVRTIENFWLLTGPLVHKQYVSSSRLPSDSALHSQIIDALRRRMPNEAGDLIVQDMREGSGMILEHLRNSKNRGRGRRAPQSAGESDSDVE